MPGDNLSLPPPLPSFPASQGPSLVVSVSSLQFGLLRLGQKMTKDIQIRNVSQLPASWRLRESPVCLEERGETVNCWGGCPLIFWGLPAV